MRKLAYFLVAAVALVACSSATDTGALETVSAQEAQGVIDQAPADLVVLDVRTPEEFDSGHLANAVNVDFYAADFADQLAGLDKDVPYVLYCNSGNRSGEALDMMADLGFAQVTEVDGGIQAWAAAGLPIVLDR
jgi:rhodanese-related sulfurtransferase